MLCIDKRAVAMRRELGKQALKQGRSYRRDEKWAGRAGPPDVADCAGVPDAVECEGVPELVETRVCVCAAEDSAGDWDVVGPDDVNDAGDGARPCIQVAGCTVS